MSEYSTEDGLKEGLKLLVGDGAARECERIVEDEASVFNLISTVQDGHAKPVMRKMSFCVILMILDYWKTAPNQAFLEMILNQFKLVDRFLYSCAGHDQEAREIFNNSRDELETRGKSQGVLALFIPNKYLQEKRLYSISKSDAERLISTGQWDKLIDPMVCQCWIRLSSEARAMTHSKKPSITSLAGLAKKASDGSESSLVAKHFFQRNQTISRKPSATKISQGTRQRSSFFKPTHEPSANSKAHELESILVSPGREDSITMAKGWPQNFEDVRKNITNRSTRVTSGTTPDPTPKDKRANTGILSRVSEAEAWLNSQTCGTQNPSSPMHRIVSEVNRDEKIPFAEPGLRSRLNRYTLPPFPSKPFHQMLNQ